MRPLPSCRAANRTRCSFPSQHYDPRTPCASPELWPPPTSYPPRERQTNAPWPEPRRWRSSSCQRSGRTESPTSDEKSAQARVQHTRAESCRKVVVDWRGEEEREGDTRRGDGEAKQRVSDPAAIPLHRQGDRRTLTAHDRDAGARGEERGGRGEGGDEEGRGSARQGSWLKWDSHRDCVCPRAPPSRPRLASPCHPAAQLPPGAAARVHSRRTSSFEHEAGWGVTASSESRRGRRGGSRVPGE